MIKSPLRYPGGKSRAVKYLSQFIPEFKEFREPFFGGGSLSFYYAQKNPAAKFIASDINYDLYCFWNEVKNSNPKIIHEVALIKKSCKDGRKLYKEIIDRRKIDLGCFQRAVDFFILNRITFSGIADSGGYSERSFHERFTDSSIERLKSAYDAIKNIDFIYSDYKELINKPGNDVFIFLDPPYYSTTNSKLYGRNGDLHTGFDHIRFFETLETCKHNFLITYDNDRFIRDLWHDFYQVQWKLQYGMNNYKKGYCEKGLELLISNYPLDVFTGNALNILNYQNTSII